jgi:hypothetical protein
MFLGNGIHSDGVYSAQTMFTPGAANGAVESPVYVVTAGSTKLSLSCTNCSNPTATATAESSYCAAYDVVVNTSYNGFLSDPFFLFVNRPWNLIAGADPVYGDWVHSYVKNNGYSTHLYYKQMSLCSGDPPMNQYSTNESFAGNAHNDYAGNNWNQLPRWKPLVRRVHK